MGHFVIVVHLVKVFLKLIFIERNSHYEKTMNITGLLPNTLYYFKVMALKYEDDVWKMSVFSQVKPRVTPSND